MPYLSVSDMTPDDRLGAYALVRTLAPALPATRWTELAERMPPGGTLVLRGPGGSVFGFASYQPVRQEGRNVLLVDNFVTAELDRSGSGRSLLADALSERAAALGCGPPRQAAEPGLLRNALAVAAA
jgi:hypothetical protein